MPLHLTEAEAEALGILAASAPTDSPQPPKARPWYDPPPVTARPDDSPAPAPELTDPLPDADHAARIVAQRCLLNGSAYLRATLAQARGIEVYNGGIRYQAANGTLCAAFPLPEALVIGLDLRGGLPTRTLVFQPLTLAQLSALAAQE